MTTYTPTKDLEQAATEVYKELMPALSGKPIDVVSLALLGHIAAMIDATEPGMGDARKACQGFGDSLWNTVIRIRTDRDARKRGLTAL